MAGRASGVLEGRGASVAGLREHNLSAVMRVLAAAPAELPRAVVAERAGLGMSALTKIVTELERRRLVAEYEDANPAGMGRPVRPLGLARRPWALLGLALERSRIKAAVGNLRGEIEQTQSFNIPATAGLAAYLPHLESAIRSLLSSAALEGRQVLAVELSVPGAANRAEGTVVRSVLNGWSAGPLAEPVAAMFPRATAVRVDRETNFSMLDALEGAPADLRTVSVAYLGGEEGLSGGLFDRGETIHGSGGLAGEFGHLVIDPHGTECWCGRRGCTETVFGLSALYAAATGASWADAQRAVAADHHGALVRLLALLEAGEPRATAALAGAGTWLGIAIDSLTASINPDAVVLDGYLAALRPHLEPTLRAYLDDRRTLPAFESLAVVFGAGHEDAALRGMILSARQQVFESPFLAE
jgi:predicted NBD/HSP70 family sugar kinase